MSDCLILLSAINKVTEKDLKPFVFVTDNVNDFSISTRGEDRHKMHENLEGFFKENIKYLLAEKITDLINKIQPDLIELERAQRLEENLNKYRELQESRKMCDHEFNHDAGVYKPSMYGGGLSLHYMCKKCGILFDTGEYFD